MDIINVYDTKNKTQGKNKPVRIYFVIKYVILCAKFLKKASHQSVFKKLLLGFSLTHLLTVIELKLKILLH